MAPGEAQGPSGTSRLFGWVMALFAIQPGEAARALLASLYLFLIICSYLLIKAIRNAMFIAEFGAMKLPYVMLGIAVLAAGAAAIYIRLARGIAIHKLIIGSLLMFAGNMLVFWLLALQGYSWLYPVLYLWAGVYGVIATTQVWTLANELFTTREAKRLFGVVGAGGILGGVIGGWATKWLAPRIGTTHLLLVVAGLLLLAALVVTFLVRLRKARTPSTFPPPKSLNQSMRLIWRSNHLRLLAGLVFITAVATTSVDFQFSLVAERFSTDRDQLTALFGFVYGTIALFSFALQLLLTSRFLTHLGVGVSIMFLPLALISATAALIPTGALWAGVLLKGSDGAFKHSLDRSCRELMYLPLPAKIKLQTKSTIDTVMDRLGDGSAGALQLFITAGLGFGLRGSLVANLFVIGVWLYLALKLKLQYVNQLRLALGRSRGRLASVGAMDGEADTLRILQQVLATGSEREKLGALEWISTQGMTIDDDDLLKLARDDPSVEVRGRALSVLLGGGEVTVPPAWVEGLEQQGHDVLVDAIDLLVEKSPERMRERLDKLLGQAGATTRLSLVAFLLRRLGPEFEPFAAKVFDGLLESTAPVEARRAAARALALLPVDSKLGERIPKLLEDQDPSVAAAAAEAAGQLRRLDLVPGLIRLLDHPRVRFAARRAIRLYGDEVVDLLVSAMNDPDGSPEIRRRVPRLLGEYCSDEAVAALVEGLSDSDSTLRRRCLDALYRLRRRYPDLRPLRGEAVVREVDRQVAGYDRIQAAAASLSRIPEAEAGVVTWMLGVLDEERRRTLARIFRMLALEFGPADMHHAGRVLAHGRTVDRANALELLDNLLPRDVKRRLLPALEGRSGPEQPIPVDEALRALIRFPHPWIVASALHTVRALGIPGVEAEARLVAGSSDVLVREEALALIEGRGVGGGA